MQPHTTNKCNHMQPPNSIVGPPKRHNLLKIIVILRIPTRRRPVRLPIIRQIALPALVATLCGCASILQSPVAGARDTQAGPRVQIWLTTADRRKQLARETDVVFHDATGASATLDINAGKRYQTMVGFGAAITDASAWLIRTRMNAAQRAALMLELFGPAPGLQISFIRLTIGASDFSPIHYSLTPSEV